MKIVLIHFYLQHLKLDCLFLGNACKISSGFFQLGNFPKIRNHVLHIHLKFRYHMIILGKSLLQIFCQPRPQGFSLKKWVGREKALASAGHVYSLNILEKLIYMQPAGFALTEGSNNGK